MSYRELRNFYEIMRSLNYPRTVLMENFRVSNFKITAEIIFWLVKGFSSKFKLSDNKFKNSIKSKKMICSRWLCRIRVIKGS